ncbi:MAG: 16S rRNA (adenine(1518)-N(6)/adenine(1519)-N(6))-dimethyltransferase RsmA [Candidatus Moraniibacteriota bacterium]
MDVKAKKSLGQNFLQDEHYLVRILETAEIVPTDKVFEVGPGTGALTEKLTKHAGKVVAVELDPRMVEHLQKLFVESEEVSILEGNILDVDINELLEHAGFEAKEYKVVANIPYYITAPIIRTLLSLRLQPKSVTLMVQKEVAERMTAKPGAMSLLSLMTQFYTDATLAFTVPKEAFLPVPKVDSAVVHLVVKRPYDPETDRSLFRLARAGFAARRKTLANNLSSSLHLDHTVVESTLDTIGLRKDIRAQALSMDDWERLRDSL